MGKENTFHTFCSFGWVGGCIWMIQSKLKSVCFSYSQLQYITLIYQFKLGWGANITLTCSCLPLDFYDFNTRARLFIQVCLFISSCQRRNEGGAKRINSAPQQL